MDEVLVSVGDVHPSTPDTDGGGVRETEGPVVSENSWWAAGTEFSDAALEFGDSTVQRYGNHLILHFPYFHGTFHGESLQLPTTTEYSPEYAHNSAR